MRRRCLSVLTSLKKNKVLPPTKECFFYNVKMTICIHGDRNTFFFSYLFEGEVCL
ncbi:hypothetical protein BDF14DRAFT_1816017 [Spinellus fusiger]|nr:hypothetical protein BDF14DRAFT_1816017 [Spinellus fusiger]